MNISKKNLAMLYRAIIWRGMTRNALEAIERIMPLEEIEKLCPSSIAWLELYRGLENIGRTNKRRKKKVK